MRTYDGQFGQEMTATVGKVRVEKTRSNPAGKRQDRQDLDQVESLSIVRSLCRLYRIGHT